MAPGTVFRPADGVCCWYTGTNAGELEFGCVPFSTARERGIYCSPTNTGGELWTALREWDRDEQAARDKYGDISEWDTSLQTSMVGLLTQLRNDAWNQDPQGDRVCPQRTESEKPFGHVTSSAHCPSCAFTAFNADISKWDVSNVQDMGQMFEFVDACVSRAVDRSAFNADLSRWDVSRVTNMNRMFTVCDRFNGDLSKWNVGKVAGMGQMFQGTEMFDGNLSAWDVANVTYMDRMFACTYPRKYDQYHDEPIPLANIHHPAGSCSFNSDLSKWDVSKVTRASAMFAYARHFNSNLSAWDVSKLTSTFEMFKGAQRFNGDVSAWNVSAVTDMDSMFADTLNHFQVMDPEKSSFARDWLCDYDDILAYYWIDGAPPGADIRSMKAERKTLEARLRSTTSPTEKAEIQSEIDDKTTAIARVEATYNSQAFNGDLSKWNVGRVTNMEHMFSKAGAFNRDISTWNVYKVTSMPDCGPGFADGTRGSGLDGMFEDTRCFNQDLSDWNVPLIGTKPPDFDSSATGWKPAGVGRPCWGPTCLPQLRVASSFDRSATAAYLVENFTKFTVGVQQEIRAPDLKAGDISSRGVSASDLILHFFLTFEPSPGPRHFYINAASAKMFYFPTTEDLGVGANANPTGPALPKLWTARIQASANSAASGDPISGIADIVAWNFTVSPPPKFRANVSAGHDFITSPVRVNFTVGTTYTIPGPNLTREELFLNPSNGDYSRITYRVGFATGSTVIQGGESGRTPSAFFVDTKSGSVLFRALHDDVGGVFHAMLVAVDAAGAEASVKAWNFTVHSPGEFGTTREWQLRRAERTQGVQSNYTVGATYTISEPALSKDRMFTHPKGGDYSRVTYRLKFARGVPSNFLVDSSSGKMVFSPTAEDVGPGRPTNYSVELVAQDSDGAPALVRQWTFVVQKNDFQLAPSWIPNRAMTAGILPIYNLSQSYLIPGPSVDTAQLFSGATGKITYALSVVQSGAKRFADGSYLADTQTGEMSITTARSGQYVAQLEARDSSGGTVLVRAWEFSVQPTDTSNPANGPNARDCAHGGSAVDEIQFDQR